ncbi:glycosyltransferase family 2 protein [bacterium]|nr:glycosyltransferase family 2 protein [bacterium]
MIKNKKIVLVMPSYNAEKTLAATYNEVDKSIVDEIILVDDASSDGTVKLASSLNIRTIVHEKNKGYGGNQKTCYRAALDTGADIVIMLHPDYQYDPRLLPAMAHLVATDLYDIVLGSRILGRGAIEGGMPRYKYFANRVLTLIENILIGQKLSEYHTGYRAYTRQVLESIPFESNSNDFIFDNEILVQAHSRGFRIGEISCPTRYFAEASSIGFYKSCVYGLGVLWVALKYRFRRP